MSNESSERICPECEHDLSNYDTERGECRFVIPMPYQSQDGWCGHRCPATTEADAQREPPSNLDDRNLACYTPPGSTYPSYISINQRNTMVEITVRSPEGDDRSCGSVAKITMNRFHFHQLINEAKTSLG